VIRMFLNEIYYCSLHLRKEGTAVTGQSPYLNIKRNSDGKYLKPSTGNWNLAPDDIPLTEVHDGIYQYEIDMASFNNAPDSYTLIYKYDSNGSLLQESEIVLYERKNRARLV
jgi:hypothetical protein